MKAPNETFTSRPSFLVVFFLALLVLCGCSSGGKSAYSTPSVPPASVSITITPSAVLPGQSATLTWSAANAKSCSANGSWTGTQALSGSTNVSLQGTAGQTYTLFCAGDGGDGSQTVTLGLASSASACTTGAAGAHRVPASRAIAAARRAVATGKAGKKPASGQ